MNKPHPAGRVDAFFKRWGTPSAPYDWAWYWRYPLGIAMMLGAFPLFTWIVSAGEPEWMAWASGVGIFLWGASIAWDLCVAVLVIGVVVAFFLWARTWSGTAQIMVFGIFLAGMIGYYQDLDRRKLQNQIDHLQRQINAIREHGFR